MPKISADKVRRDEYSVYFTPDEVAKILKDAAIEAAMEREGMTRPESKKATAKLEIRQETAGSPSYEIQAWNARVSLVVDQGTNPQVLDAGPHHA